ncbi:MAG TPA: hypothetical protein VIZ30_02680, partial [Pseudomonadales bacterium]
MDERHFYRRPVTFSPCNLGEVHHARCHRRNGRPSRFAFDQQKTPATSRYHEVDLEARLISEVVDLSRRTSMHL